VIATTEGPAEGTTVGGQTVEVRFKGTRKAYFIWPHGDDPLRVTNAVVVESERGRDLGRVTAVGDTATKKCATGCDGCAVGGAEEPEPLRPVVRRATPEDLKVHAEARRSEEEVRQKVMQRVRAHELVMKVSDAEWQWDRAKLTIYFTAEKRVDFRNLVRDLASLFRTRIELRQIGVRDEAARLGGVGRCGKEYCCSTWLKELSPVNLGLAKDQHLSLNPSQISGGCGRLLCCLKYEHEFYVTSRKRFPKEGKVLRTSAGLEKVVAVDIFRERVYLRTDSAASRIIPLDQLREEMEAADQAAPSAPAAAAATAAPPAPPAPPAPSAPVAPVAPSPPVSSAPTRPAPPAAEPDAPPSDGSASERSGSDRRRRRRRRRRSGGEPGTDGPPDPSSSPDA
jgi:cell fate regulator YaaT (PSP1 superfamily)